MNNENKSLDIVEGFFKAINTGDFDKAKSFMANNHEYVGPMFSTKNPEDYFEKLKAFEMEFAVETQDMLVGENGLTHRSLLKVLNPVQATIPCCEVFIVDNNKITHQYFYFDTALFPKP
ncbi:nuclear transport factor 2 family protein [uncultured Psychroserpens sp.]|uniref:nuclear transport factor 2 family protein n=1 Tax=uncultured Psychroserpens sp. TaxID=255436 RepID=UPI0026016454|nr:nuclear transport factor 2 family protein [uncultured Psychroserpens sp.]